MLGNSWSVEGLDEIGRDGAANSARPRSRALVVGEVRIPTAAQGTLFQS
jgi:hypothetical protein